MRISSNFIIKINASQWTCTEINENQLKSMELIEKYRFPKKSGKIFKNIKKIELSLSGRLKTQGQINSGGVYPAKTECIRPKLSLSGQNWVYPAKNHRPYKLSLPLSLSGLESEGIQPSAWNWGYPATFGPSLCKNAAKQIQIIIVNWGYPAKNWVYPA